MDGLRRWSGTIALAVLVSFACVAAGMWQWNRHEQRSAAIALVETNYEASVAPLDQVLPDAGITDVGGQAARQTQPVAPAELLCVIHHPVNPRHDRSVQFDFELAPVIVHERPRARP